jgi:hypothetical protein
MSVTGGPEGEGRETNENYPRVGKEEATDGSSSQMLTQTTLSVNSSWLRGFAISSCQMWCKNTIKPYNHISLVV